eukprot:7413540-Heterocapsa_arctica.AAC.1
MFARRNSPELGPRDARAVQALDASRRCTRRSLWRTAEIPNYEFDPTVPGNRAEGLCPAIRRKAGGGKLPGREGGNKTGHLVWTWSATRML